jgi:hypothetical protein
VAVAALLATQVRGVPASENFFKDFAAYLQFIIGLPLFVVAERIVSEHTREALLPRPKARRVACSCKGCCRGQAQAVVRADDAVTERY